MTLPDELGKRLLGVGAALTPFLAFLGLQGAALDRISRNDQRALVVIVALFVVGFALSALAVSTPRLAVPLSVVALVTFAIAFVTTASVSASSKSTKERPLVSSELAIAEDGALRLSFTAKVQGLRSSEALGVEVEGLNSSQPVYRQVPARWGTLPLHSEPSIVSKRHPDDPTEEWVTRLSYLLVGPDSSGVASYSGSIQVPPGVYERVRVVGFIVVVVDDDDAPSGISERRCDLGRRYQACVATALPISPTRPRLSLDRGDGSATVVIAANGLATVDVVKYTVWLLSPTDPPTQLASGSGVPDSRGVVNEQQTVVTAAGTGTLCIEAAIVRPVVRVPASPPASSGPETGSSAPPASAAGSTAGADANPIGGANGAPGPVCSDSSTRTTARMRL